MWQDEDTRRRTFIGQETVTELGRRAVVALEEAGFVDELAALRQRVFSRPAPVLFSTHLSPGGAWSLHYKPMVELLLIHVAETAEAGRPRTRAARRSVGRWRRAGVLMMDAAAPRAPHFAARSARPRVESGVPDLAEGPMRILVRSPARSRHVCFARGQSGTAGRRATRPRRLPARAHKKAWDVNAPPGPASTVSIDTRTGTWMSVDVSPDGRTLVFDLLGRHLLDARRGRARPVPLTHSMAWDMQPRFSPDGRRIASPQRRGRRRQRLGDERRRHATARGHRGGLPPGQQPGVAPGRRVHRGAQALQRHAQPGVG